jgi:hypothetical protein
MNRDRLLTTYEAADLLACEADHALALLKGAGVPYERIGRAYLWDADSVRRLIQALRPANRKGAAGAD